MEISNYWLLDRDFSEITGSLSAEYSKSTSRVISYVLNARKAQLPSIIFYRSKGTKAHYFFYICFNEIPFQYT
jgi:hypothetical protein